MAGLNATERASAAEETVINVPSGTPAEIGKYLLDLQGTDPEAWFTLLGSSLIRTQTLRIDVDETINIPGLRDNDIVVLDGQNPAVIFNAKKPDNLDSDIKLSYIEEKDQPLSDEYTREMELNPPWEQDSFIPYDIYQLRNDITDAERNKMINDYVPAPDTEYSHRGVIQPKTSTDFTSASYTYDANGQRTGKSYNTKTTYTYYDSSVHTNAMKIYYRKTKEFPYVSDNMSKTGGLKNAQPENVFDFIQKLSAILIEMNVGFGPAFVFNSSEQLQFRRIDRKINQILFEILAYMINNKVIDVVQITSLYNTFVQTSDKMENDYSLKSSPTHVRTSMHSTNTSKTR